MPTIIQTRDVARLGAGGITNYLLTGRAAESPTLRTTFGQVDSPWRDLRLLGGLAAVLGASQLEGTAQSLVRGAGEGALHSFVATEQMRRKVSAMCEARGYAAAQQAPAVQQPAQLPPPAPQGMSGTPYARQVGVVWE